MLGCSRTPDFTLESINHYGIPLSLDPNHRVLRRAVQWVVWTPGSGPELSHPTDFPNEKAVRTLPRDHPGGRGQETRKKQQQFSHPDHLPPGSGPETAQNIRSSRESGRPDPLRGRARHKIKTGLTYRRATGAVPKVGGCVETSQPGQPATHKVRLQCIHTGFEKPHETTLKLVYRAENRCKSIGAQAGGLSQAFLGPIWARKGPKTYIFRPKKSLKALLTALE
jgi:hypothetical protein